MLEAAIHLIDVHNPSIGYQVRIERNGQTLLYASRNPATGADLSTFADAMEVLQYYTKGGK